MTVARRTGVTIAEMGRMWWRKQTVADVKVRARKFRESLVRLGPFYVKLGQALSTRPDILPPEYCAELALLQDRMAPFPCHVALATVQRELGVPPGELFAEFSPAPVAAASLGQVYKARLRSGEWVAVKIQRPAVQQQIALDSLVVRRVAALLQPLVHGRSDLVAIADQLVCRMFDEVDYEQEGRNAERFQALYGDHRPVEQGQSQSQASQGMRRGLVKVPRIFWKYSSRRVLTMEWIDGIKLTDRAGLLQAGLNTQFVVDLGVLCSLRQLLEEGFFHADPHPGNLVVTRGGQLAYFDFGMMGELPPQQRISIIRAVSGPVAAVAAADAPFLLSSQCPLHLVVHYVNRDAHGLAQDFRALHFIPPEADAAPVAAALAEVFREGAARKGDSMSGSTSGMDFQGVILRLSSVMYRFRFSLPPHLSLVVRALGSLEGTATTLDPNFKVVATAYPFIIARLLSDPSPDMRAILRQMLLWPSGAIRWQRLQRLASVLSKPSPQHSTGLDHSSPIEAQEGETRARVSAEEKQQTTVSGEEKQGGQRDELREGVDAAAVVAAAGAFETSQKERQRGQRDELREGVDEAAVVAAAGDFLAYVLSAEGSSTRGWLVLDAVAAGQQWVDERVGSTGKERWVEEEEVGRREGKGRRRGVEGVGQEGRGESRGERGVRQEGRGESRGERGVRQEGRGESRGERGVRQEGRGESRGERGVRQEGRGESRGERGVRQEGRGESRGERGVRQEGRGESRGERGVRQEGRGESRGERGVRQEGRGESRGERGVRQEGRGESRGERGVRQEGRGESRGERGVRQEGRGESRGERGVRQEGRGESRGERGVRQEGRGESRGERGVRQEGRGETGGEAGSGGSPNGPLGSTGSSGAARTGAATAATLLDSFLPHLCRTHPPPPTSSTHPVLLQWILWERWQQRCSAHRSSLAAAVQRAPELWVPLLVETAGRAEAREMAGRVVRGVASHAADSAVESALLAVSRWLHSK
ncbi:unnamed protein product [Closterium sp. NIES-64]|nr:unnamed protein product [Closterium sp. NIES-64]